MATASLATSFSRTGTMNLPALSVGSLEHYISAVNRIPMLTLEREQALVRVGGWTRQTRLREAPVLGLNRLTGWAPGSRMGRATSGKGLPAKG